MEILLRTHIYVTCKRTHGMTHNTPTHTHTHTHIYIHKRQSSFNYWFFYSPISSVLAPPVVLRSNDWEISVESSYALIGKLATMKMATLSHIYASLSLLRTFVYLGYFPALSAPFLRASFATRDLSNSIHV